MEYLLFILGLVFGSVVSQIISYIINKHKDAYGWFVLTPIYESNEHFNIKITIQGEQNLLKKDKIILYKTQE